MIKKKRRDTELEMKVIRRIKEKIQDTGLEMKVFRGRDDNFYLIFKTQQGSYHALIEVEAKQAARECGSPQEAHTRTMWKAIWDKV
jgi:hypothetical protein